MGVKITVKGADYEQSVNAGSISAYVSALNTIYNLSQKEIDALTAFSDEVSDVLMKAKFLYLFLGNNAEAQSLNVVNPKLLPMKFGGAGTYTKKGFGLGKGIFGDTGYKPTGEELQDFSFICYGKDLKPGNNHNGTLMGMRKGPGQDRFTLTYAGGTQKRLYYVPGVGDWGTQQVALPAENSKDNWIAGSIDSSKIELYTEDYKTSKDTFGFINNANSIYIGGENQGNAPVDISHFVSGTMQVAGTFKKLSEAEVRSFVKALETLNVSFER